MPVSCSYLTMISSGLLPAKKYFSMAPPMVTVVTIPSVYDVPFTFGVVTIKSVA